MELQTGLVANDNVSAQDCGKPKYKENSFFFFKLNFDFLFGI